MQKLVYPRLLEAKSPLLETHLTRRLRRWNSQFPFMPHETILAKTAMQNMVGIGRQLEPCIFAALLQTYCCGWPSARRFNLESRSCLLGCGAVEGSDPCSPDDSIEHYTVCPVTAAGWEHCTRNTNSKGPLGVLGFSDEPKEFLTARCAYLYCMYTVIVRSQVKRQPICRSSFMRLIEERRRRIEVRCKRAAEAFRAPRAAQGS